MMGILAVCDLCWNLDNTCTPCGDGLMLCFSCYCEFNDDDQGDEDYEREDSWEDDE